MRKILISLLMTVSTSAYANQTKCLAQAIYHEARGEPYQCQQLVADVVLNRMKHPNYPSTACGVVFQRNQFSWTSKPAKITDDESWQKSLKLASYKLSTQKKSTTAIYFTQGKRFGPVVARCGKHIFMKAV